MSGEVFAILRFAGVRASLPLLGDVSSLVPPHQPVAEAAVRFTERSVVGLLRIVRVAHQFGT